jgi:putative transposase
MPQSLSKVYVHCIFSTKNGQCTIKDEVRKDLHSYIIGTLSNLGSYVYEIYPNPDHIHILFSLPRTITIASMVSKIKTSASKWMKTKGITGFSWQNGYGIFSVSSSKIAIVKRYIQNQKEHHKKISFKEEYITFLKEYEITYDERYVWD